MMREKNALRTVLVYNVERDKWGAAAKMGEERDECEGVVVEERGGIGVPWSFSEKMGQKFVKNFIFLLKGI